MKKNNLINKYDFVNYFTKQPSLWFFSNAEILSGIEFETRVVDFDEDDNELEEGREENIIDYYELYKELLANNEDIDKNNPHIVEGLIIDEKSRQFIVKSYSYINTIIDLEKQKNIKQYESHKLADLTKSLILEHDKIIIFQPVFMYNNLITKPDAIVKDGEKIILIETKGTTNAKLYHALDIYFQSKVLRSLEYLNDFYFEYKLCLIAYEYQNKDDVSFILSDTFNYTKTPSGLDKYKSVAERQLCKLGQKPSEDNEDFYIYFNSICNDSVEDFETKIENSKGITKIKLTEIMNDFITIFNDFDNIIDELINHLKDIRSANKLMCININPHPNDKNKYRTNEFTMLKKLYLHKGYDIFKYSAKWINFNQNNLKLIASNKDYNILDLASKLGNALIPIVSEANNRKFVINYQFVNSLLSNLKKKKVYFDFETISSSIRPIDNCLPFMQVVTQCSIIVDNGKLSLDELECNNMFFDPTNINVEQYKSMIDNLYHGPEYSYVVYNKTFESLRLKEIRTMINDNTYSEKITTIINNMFDLADFFMYKKDFSCIPIFIKELYGYYSIKKVLPFVQKNYNDLYIATNCKDYKDLEISNGLICQNLTTLHFLKKDGNNNQWLDTMNNMKIYCENDVRAMIAVELFIKHISSTTN